MAQRHNVPRVSYSCTPPQLLTPSQVARLWGVSRRTVQRYIADGKIPAIRLPGGQYRIRAEDAQAAIEAAS
jgi:excisionase family DNA binding protein